MKLFFAIISFTLCGLLFPGISLSQEANKPDGMAKQNPDLIFFAGIGSSYQSVLNISDIDESFATRAPFGSMEFFGGVSIFKGLVEISLLSSRSHGIITHDESMNLPYGEYRLFYADRIETSIVAYGVNVGLHPLSDKRISPVLSLGISSNSYKNYSRSVYEEILVISTNLVLNNYFDDFEEPDNFNVLNLRAGIDFKINDRNIIRCFAIYGNIDKTKFGIQNIKSAGILYKRNFR